MKIKVPSRSSTAPQTIIIRERRGLGCGGVVGIVVALLADRPKGVTIAR